MKKTLPLMLIVIGLCLAYLLLPEPEEVIPPPDLNPVVAPVVVVPKPPVTFEDPDPVSLADLLKKPRTELAGLGAKVEQEIQEHEKLRQEGRLNYLFLPQNRFPEAIPIWNKARFDAARDMLLPPYMGEQKFDGQLALHLARHGDIEGAHKIADPADTSTLAQIDRLTLGQNYPAEWSRLVGLLLHRAHQSLALDSSDAARRIASLHTQLTTILDEKARRSPLGATLLPRGKRILENAVLVWQKSNQEELAKLAQDVLKRWGEAPWAELPPWNEREQVERWFGSPAKGLLIAATRPDRAVDLLALTLPANALHGMVAFCNPAGKLQEILLWYGPELIEIYEPKHLHFWLEDQLASADPTSKKFNEELLLTHTNTFVGPLVRIVPAGAGPPAEPEVPRDFGPVSLDRGFEHNRRLFAWKKAPPHPTVTDAKVLHDLKSPLAEQPWTKGLLVREAKHDLVAHLELSLASGEKGRPQLMDLAGPFWQTLGVGQIQVTGSTSKDSVNLVWKDARTSIQFRLPHLKDGEITLDIRDVSGQDPAKREELARIRDEADRQERWTRNQPLTRLTRSVEIFELGMSRADLDKKLTPINALKGEVPGGLLLTFPGPGQKNAPAILRQGVVRLDDAGKVVEIYLRYMDGSNQKAGSALAVLDPIRQRAGAPEAAEGKWRWLDDATLLVSRQDKEGLDLFLKDCPRAKPQTTTLSPRAWLPRGPKDCLLGTSKEDVHKFWRTKPAEMVGEAEFYPMPTGGRYESILVWYEKDRVSRVAAPHRLAKETLANPDVAGKTVLATWSDQAQEYGWPFNQELAGANQIQALSNQDDFTQVRIFWQETDNGLKVFTEWKEPGRE